MSDAMRETIRTLVAEQRAVPDDDSTPLELQSLELVMLAERIEEAFGVQVKAVEVVPEHFGTVAGLLAFVQRKRATT